MSTADITFPEGLEKVELVQRQQGAGRVSEACDHWRKDGRIKSAVVQKRAVVQDQAAVLKNA